MWSFKSFFKSNKKAPSRRDQSRTLRLEPLEDRKLMSVNSLWFSGSTLCVKANDAATSVEVHQSGTNVVVAEVGTTKSWSYPSTSVGCVEFQGGAGNDRFVDNIANLKTRAFGAGGNDYFEGYNGDDYFAGGDGDDTLVGYGGNDTLYGGNGNDTIRGMAGNDQLIGEAGNDKLDGGDGDDLMWGGAGNDILLGGNGNDQLMGEDGNDHLNGQDGADKLWGGNGDDVLIAIDAAISDYVQGDAGNDVMWIDQNGSSRDTVYGAATGDKVQYVTSFTNGADRTLNGDRIADPTLKSGQSYRQFSGNPLFSSNGPAASDIRQGNLGDCWLLSGLGAIANDRPAAINENVVDFDDGTYGVHLGNSFYRVDNDLPVSSGTNLADASLGRDNSMWVAVVEKAYASYRTGQNSYASLEGGWSVDVNRAFGSTSAGTHTIESYSSATALANEIATRWSNREAVTIGFLNERNAGTAGAQIVTGHMYAVMGVNRNSSGVVTSIVIRNPWGVDGNGNAADGVNDGLVTVTPSQLFHYTGQVNWGRV